MNEKIRALLSEIFNSAKAKIVELANTELKDEVKKQKLDTYIVNVIKATMDRLGFNPIARFVVNKFVIPYVDDITQYIYDLLKAKVKGVTKK